MTSPKPISPAPLKGCPLGTTRTNRSERNGCDEAAGVDRAGDDADVADPLRDKADDLVGQALLEVDRDLRMGREEGTERLGQELGQGVGVREDPDLPGEPAGEGGEILLQALALSEEGPGAGRGCGRPGSAPPPAGSAPGGARQAISPCCGCGCSPPRAPDAPARAMGDAAGVDDVLEEVEVGQIELHGRAFAAFAIREGRVDAIRIACGKRAAHGSPLTKCRPSVAVRRPSPLPVPSGGSSARA